MLEIALDCFDRPRGFEGLALEGVSTGRFSFGETGTGAAGAGCAMAWNQGGGGITILLKDGPCPTCGPIAPAVLGWLPLPMGKPEAAELTAAGEEDRRRGDPKEALFSDCRTDV